MYAVVVRSDIRKVVFERAKAGRTWASKTPRAKHVVLDSEGEQLNENSNSIRRKRQKMRNSHFNAVERFLIRNIGRPWDAVYAEICASADPRNLLGNEVRAFVQTIVSMNCWHEGEKVMTQDWRGLREVRGLYLHPTNRVLLRSARA
jgi:hypothetical protein